MSNLAQTMMAKIDRGARLESADEMTGEYRESLVHLLTMQADSELAGGYGYVPWITKAPTVEEKHVVAQIVKDELRHAAVMYGLLADLGFDVASHVRRHDTIFTMRISSDADLGTARITSDKRVNIFGRPGSPKNELYRKYRLKLRDNDEVRQAFAREVRVLCDTFGLTVPEWTPKWAELPEEAHIPG